MIAQISAVMLAALGATAQQAADTTLAVAQDGRLEIHNLIEGSVVIGTWDRSEVRVETRSERPDAVEIRGDGTSVTIRVRPERSRGVSETDFEITVPRGLSLEIQGVTTDVTAENVGGNVKVNSVEGEIRVKGGRGNVSLQTVDGDVQLEDAEGNLAVQSVEGDVTLRGVSGVVSAQAVDGDVTLDGVTSDNVQVSSVDGDILYRGTVRDDGRYTISTHDGDLTVYVPGGANARVSVATFSGDLEADFPVTVEGEVGQKRFSFTLGSGKALVDLSTFDGTVYLKKQ